MQKTITLPFKKVLIFTILILLVASMVFLFLPGKIYGDTLNVGPGETYTTIQSAITAADPDDTIVVAAGTYNETLVIDKNITLTGAGASSSIIDPEATGRSVTINSGNVNISGFTMQGGNTSGGGGIYNTSSGTLSISNSTISGNNGGLLGGGILNEGTLTISNSTISENTANRGGGIYNTSSGTLSISNSTISGNTASDLRRSLGGGIFNEGTLTISNSTINGNTADLGGGIYSISEADARNNWWGSSTGPTNPSNPDGTGDSIYGDVDYIPWLMSPPDYSEPSGQIEQPAIWVRDREMTCYQVWINEDNNFEFVFWWEYKNNNWVKIYDMEGNEVFSIDMKYGNAKFIADLPDGFYIVKTFHDGFETPIQEFLIGKP